MQYGRSGDKQFDMSGTEHVRGETALMTLHCDNIIDWPGIDALATGTEPQAD